MFDGDLIAGPVPTMFAEDPEVTKEALKADIYRAHFDMAKFERVFLQPEHVVLGEAFEIVNEPRYDKIRLCVACIRLFCIGPCQVQQRRRSRAQTQHEGGSRDLYSGHEGRAWARGTL